MDELRELFGPSASQESFEQAKQLASRRLGAGVVHALEQPKRDMAMLKGKPIALPWATGKHLGYHVDEAEGGARRVLDSDGQVVSVELTICPSEAELDRLNDGARQLETQEMVNRGLGVPATDAYDEGDHLAMNDGVIQRCEHRDGTLRCIWLEGHSGPCKFDPLWG